MQVLYQDGCFWILFLLFIRRSCMGELPDGGKTAFPSIEAMRIDTTFSFLFLFCCYLYAVCTFFMTAFDARFKNCSKISKSRCVSLVYTFSTYHCPPIFLCPVESSVHVFIGNLAPPYLPSISSRIAVFERTEQFKESVMARGVSSSLCPSPTMRGILIGRVVLGASR